MMSCYLTLLPRKGAWSGSSSIPSASSSSELYSLSDEEISKSNSLVSLPEVLSDELGGCGTIGGVASMMGDGGRGGGVVSLKSVVCGSGLCSRTSGSSSRGCGLIGCGLST